MQHLIRIEKIAKLAHEINRAYCLSLGDNSQVSWEEAPAIIRNSAIAGVKLHMENPEATPEDSHESWLKYKVAEGWVYGVEKDIEKKTHPCMIPYSALPLEQRTKDFLFKAAIKQGEELLKVSEVSSAE